MPSSLAVAVDDDAAILKLIQMVLSPFGYEVKAFSSAQAALMELQQGLRPTVILSDVSMPEMDGYDFFEQVQAIQGLEVVPFLFLSARTEREHIRQGMTLGADDYVTKPFSPDELAQAVRVRVARQQELKRQVEGLITVRAMGQGVVLRDGVLLVWDSQKALELFFYLLENRAGVSTWQVAEALWPGKTEAKASSSFHTTLYRLRKVIGDEMVESSNRRYYLNSKMDFDYDVARYRELSATAKDVKTPEAFGEAISAYKGDFLPDFDSPWILDMRATMRDEHLTLLLFAAEASLEAGRLESAGNFFEMMTQYDPDAEEAWQGLARSLELRGLAEEAERVREKRLAL